MAFSKKGIDVSASQGKIDFSKVKAAGIDFVIIRCGYGGDYESQDDPYFERNVEECEKYGIPWGTYLYSYATDLQKAESEVQHILRLIKGKKPEYPVFLDMEDSDGYKEKRDVSDQMCIDICELVCSRLEEAGYYTGIYANLYWLTHRIDSRKLDRFDKWLAQWASAPTYDKPFGMWQNSNDGSVDGISGRVDTDISYKDYPSIIREAGLNGYSDSEPAPEPEPEAKFKVGDIVRVREGALSYEGKRIASFVYDREYRIDELCGNRAVLDKTGINTAFNTDDLILSGEEPAPEPEPEAKFKVGDIVQVKKGARSYEGKKVASFVYKGRYRIDELSGNRAVLDKTGINTAFNTDDLILSSDEAGISFVWYTVKAGDSFWKIAKEQMGSGLKYMELAHYNGLRVTAVIHPGQLLKIPK